VTDRVLGSLGLAPGDRQGYERYMEARALELELKAGRRELEVVWEGLRRGWYVGREDFRLVLLARVKRVLLGQRRESHAGGVRQAHDQHEAARLLSKGLRRLRLQPAELVTLPKGRMEKLVLAWWLRRHTTVSLRWISEQLSMGHVSRVSLAVNLVETKPTGKMRESKINLEACLS
jgi:hypothetical protein